MLKHSVSLVCVLAVASIANAAVTVNVVPTGGADANNLMPGQSFSADLMVSQDTGVARNLRDVRFDFSTTDGAIGLSNFQWDTSTLASNALLFLDSALPVPSGSFTGLSELAGFQLNLPASGDARLGTIDVTAPNAPGTYNLNAITASDDTNPNLGGLFSWGFGGAGDAFTENFANNGDVVGGSLNLIVPEPATIAFLGLGGLALIRRRRKA